MSAPCSGSTLMAGSCKVRATMLATLPAFLIPPLMSSCARVDDSPLGHKRTFAVSLDHLGKWCARRSNNFRNLIRTPRTFIGVLVMTRLVGKDAHEQHAAAARRTSRTHKNSRRLSGDRRHTHTNKQTEARDPLNLD